MHNAVFREDEFLVARWATPAGIEVAIRVGFNDPAYFSRVFRRYTGRSPRAFRNAPPYGEATGT